MAAKCQSDKNHHCPGSLIKENEMKLDMNKVEAFAGQVVTDISATFSGVMTNIGHKLGLY